MPILKVCKDGIRRYKEASNTSGGVLVSNFTIALRGQVRIKQDGGGSGFLVEITRFPDRVSKYVHFFCGNLLCCYEVYPTGISASRANLNVRVLNIIQLFLLNLEQTFLVFSFECNNQGNW